MPIVNLLQMKTMFLRFSLVSLAATLLLCSCGSAKKVTYFQDTKDGAAVEIIEPRSVTIQPADKLQIIVSSRDPELAAIFNLAVVSHSAVANGISGGFTGSGYNQSAFYTVNDNGEIDFPVLGRIYVAGLKREDLAEKIKGMIISRDLIRDAVVTVELANMYVSILGDIARPGRIALDKDRFSIIDAITKAGDLNITGQRKTVKVYREENGRQVCHVIDFTSAENVFSSPVFYLRQDDIIYVEPNGMRKRQSTVNGNNLLSASFWVSLGSLLTSVTSLVIGIVRP